MMGFDLQFQCPDCGGSSFGSMAEDLQNPAGPVLRFCHGNDAGDGRAGCRFSFHERDDWKYFTCNGEKIQSPAQYDAIMEKIRSTLSYGIGPLSP
jgi:hypothetical protein